MPGFGVTEDGFNIKPFDTILAESLGRAKQAFGQNVDLSSTSALRKILEVSAFEDAEIWKRLEDLYYSNFVSTAIGDNLELLGTDLGLPRRQMFSGGTVTFTLKNPVQGRLYPIPEGTVVVTAAPVMAFHTTQPATLTSETPQVDVPVLSFERGPAQDVPSNSIVDIDPAYRKVYFDNIAPAQIEVKNAQPFTGGLGEEDEEDYREFLLGYPRTIWTLDSVQRAVLAVDGVVDVRLNDRLGGVDVSQSVFNLFNFNERLFSENRRLGAAYFFDVIVAHYVGWPWRTLGPVPGVFERVSEAVNRVRPVGIYANILEANHIEVGVSAKVIVERGYDPQALVSAIKEQVGRDIGKLKLGDDVLFSQVMRAFVEQPGVVDVQGMRLRRCPPSFNRISFGPVVFQSDVLEVAVGENLSMDPTEIAIFRLDSDLIDLEQVEAR